MRRFYASLLLTLAAAGCAAGGSTLAPRGVSSRSSVAGSGTAPVPSPSPTPSPTFTGPAYGALGDSITYGYADQPQPITPYPTIFALVANFTPTDLGIDGANAPLVVEDELPHLPPSCSLVTLDIGTNDANYITQGYETEADFRNALTAIASTAASVCPHATIAFSNVVINFASIEAEAKRLNRILAHWPRVVHVDLQHDPRMHEPQYFALDGLHPNEAGQHVIAEDFLAALRVTNGGPPATQRTSPDNQIRASRRALVSP